MKEDQPEGTRVASLLGLYLGKKEELLTDLPKRTPDKAADQISSFIRALERPYTDIASDIGTPAHLVHHVLNTVAAASQSLVSVEASVANAKYQTPAAGSNSSGKFAGYIRSTPIFYLFGVIIACVLAVILILTNNPDPAVLPIVSLIVIAILATVGATTSGSGSGQAPTLTPKITLSVDVATLDKKISHALRVADELLEAASLAYKTEGQKDDRPQLEPKRTFELLQALASHRMASFQEKEASDLAGDAIRILFNAKVKPVEYTGEQAHLFEQRPAGITEPRTLLPALIDEHGELVCEGVVLTPIA
uniref:Uncharacterized protein n=1 Tax=Roseihalotalea indica TaxID=2867963 RepID=A0AA49GT92_9BACT|nr:hypothetical protein K4G66_07440 [Tunicatimonas sp. TK19036]